MWLRVTICVVSAVTAVCACAETSPDISSALYSKLGRQVYQVRTARGVSDPKSSYGSGFVVSQDGIIVTNFHVISEALFSQSPLHIYVVVGNERVEARLIKTDVRNDLALLVIPRHFEHWLELSDNEPAQGDKVFSLGMPEDLNMSIVDGTYNGVLRYGPFDRIHLSSPINSGMSGGPTVDAQGQVVGVNVSRYLFSSNIAFAVPAARVRALIKGAKAAEAPKVAELKTSVGRDLYALQDELTTMILTDSARYSKKMGSWAVFEASDMLKCWNRTIETKSDAKFARVEQSCDLGHAVFVKTDVQVAQVSMDLDWLENKGLNTLRFFSLLGQTYDSSYLYNDDPDDPGRDFSEYRCSENRVLTERGVPLQAAVCLRAIIEFPDLYELKIKLATLKKSTSNVVARAEFSGFSLENSQKLTSRFLDAVNYADSH
jgi:serine protease Do